MIASCSLFLILSNFPQTYSASKDLSIWQNLQRHYWGLATDHRDSVSVADVSPQWVHTKTVKESNPSSIPRTNIVVPATPAYSVSGPKSHRKTWPLDSRDDQQSSKSGYDHPTDPGIRRPGSPRDEVSNKPVSSFTWLDKRDEDPPPGDGPSWEEAVCRGERILEQMNSWKHNPTTFADPVNDFKDFGWDKVTRPRDDSPPSDDLSKSPSWFSTVFLSIHYRSIARSSESSALRSLICVMQPSSFGMLPVSCFVLDLLQFDRAIDLTDAA